MLIKAILMQNFGGTNKEYIMVFLKVIYVNLMLCLVFLQGPHQPLMVPVPKLINLS